MWKRLVSLVELLISITSDIGVPSECANHGDNVKQWNDMSKKWGRESKKWGRESKKWGRESI